MSDYPVYIQYFTPEWPRFNQIIQSFKGSRTMAQYAEDCKAISPSSLSRIATGKVTRPLPADVIISLYKNRDKNSEYSLEDLMKANGMIDESTYKRITATAANQSTSEKRYNESMMQNILVNELLNRGIAIKIRPETMSPREYAERESSGNIPLRPDLMLFLPEAKSPSSWIFEFITAHADENAPFITPKIAARRAFDKMSIYLIADAWAPEKYKNDKTSFVFQDENIYEAFRSFFKRNRLNNIMSTILIDPKAGTVIKEELLNLNCTDQTSFFDLPTINTKKGDEWSLVDDDATYLEALAESFGSTQD